MSIGTATYRDTNPMNRYTRILLAIMVLGIFAYAASLLTGNEHVWRGLRQSWMRGAQNAQVDDLKFQQTVTVAANNPQPWPKHSRYGDVALTAEQVDSTQALRTVSIALIHRDSLLFEWANPDIDDAGQMECNSFSAAKTLTALAIGAAEDRGLLSTEDRVAKHLPRFDGGMNGKLTIEEVLQMRTSIPFGEDYKDPFGFMAKCYYGRDVRSLLPQYEVEGKPGFPWKYQGGNTLLLGEILNKVTGMSIAEWFSETIWTPSGATKDAKWGVDEKNFERNFAAFYTTSVEFAKLGNMALNRGRVGDVQVLSESFIHRLQTPVGPLEDGADILHYGYQTWLGNHREHSFFVFIGLHGQYIICVPDLDLVYVRTGFTRTKEKLREIDVDVYKSIDISMAMTGQI
jgi:CubicO group peptidase (beta-lactamase class C family)